MEESKRFKEQTFSFRVESSGKLVKKDLELEDSFANVQAIAVSSDRNDLLYFRGNFPIVSVDSIEVWNDYDASMLMASVHHAPNEKYKNFPNVMEVEGKKVNIRYQDNDHPQAAFAPYTVRVYVYGEMN